MKISEQRLFLDLVAVMDSLEPEARVEAIDDLIHRLKFERRVTLLTPDQLNHMSSVLSTEQRERLQSLKTEKEREGVIDAYARAMYFRNCAWSDYLNGIEDKPPFKSREQHTCTNKIGRRSSRRQNGWKGS